MVRMCCRSTTPVYYTSLDPQVVSVTEDGTLTAHQAGTGLIRAMLNTGDYTLVAVHVADHVEEVRGAKAATCTEDGYSGDVLLHRVWSVGFCR